MLPTEKRWGAFLRTGLLWEIGVAPEEALFFQSVFVLFERGRFFDAP